MITPNSNGAPEPDNINEAWSDAARAAAAAARVSRKTGKSKMGQRLAIRRAFKKAGGSRSKEKTKILSRRRYFNRHLSQEFSNKPAYRPGGVR